MELVRLIVELVCHVVWFVSVLIASTVVIGGRWLMESKIDATYTLCVAIFLMLISWRVADHAEHKRTEEKK